MLDENQVRDLNAFIDGTGKTLGCSFTLSCLVRSFLTLVQEREGCFLEVAREWRRRLQRPVNGDHEKFRESEMALGIIIERALDEPALGNALARTMKDQATKDGVGVGGE